MNLRLFALFCAFTFLFSGCAINNNGPNNSETEASSNEGSEKDTQEYLPLDNSAVHIYYEEENELYNADDGKDLFHFTYQRPNIAIDGHEDAADAIMDFFDTHYQKFQETAETYFSEALLLYEDKPENFSKYYLTVKFEILRCDNEVLSMQCLSSDYTGGIHGTYEYTGMNFDIQTGKLLTLDNISTDRETLTQSALACIKSQLKLSYYEKGLLNRNAETMRKDILESVITDDTWYFTNSGLTFVSNIYVLSQYAAGAYFFTVPYKQLEGLKPEYQYTGPFELSAIIGSTLSADLDHDENIEAIYYEASYKADVDELFISFIINGTDFSSRLQDETCQLTVGATAEGLEYYLMDLDASDDFIEIIILDSEMDGTEISYIFRYNRGELNFLGSLPEYPSSPTFRTDALILYFSD